jgi:hypothetical protein
MLSAKADEAADAASEGATTSPESPRAVLVLRNISEVPAAAMLEVADRLRRAVRRIGIADVRIEVKMEGEPSTPRTTHSPKRRSIPLPQLIDLHVHAKLRRSSRST